MLPATTHVPKLLLPVHGRPFFDWLAPRLIESGLDDIVLCVGHLADEIRSYLRARPAFESKVRLVDEGARRLGTGGAIALADELGLLEETFAITYGDSFLTNDYAAPLRRLESDDSPTDAFTFDGVMAVYENDVAHEPSNAEVVDGRVVRYEKGVSDPKLRWIDHGVMALRRSVVRRAAEHLGPVFGLDQIQRDLARSGRLGAVIATERFHEIGSPTGHAELEKFLSSDLRITRPAG